MSTPAQTVASAPVGDLTVDEGPQGVENSGTHAVPPALAQHMAMVDSRLSEVVAGCGPRLADVAIHLVEAGGKRLRPTLTLASAVAAAGPEGVGPRVIDAAAAVELLHVASLYHDDVLDSAPTRRGRSTANAVWGNRTSILTGDALLAQAFALAAELGIQALQRFSRTVIELCAGQVAETRAAFDPARAICDYERSIRNKTARLLAMSCWLGASTVDAPAPTLHLLARFGEELGVAFQLIDDLLDLYGDPAALGKPAGTDLRAGVFTLPVLLMVADDPATADLLGDGIDEARINQVRARVSAAGADRRTAERALAHVEAALAELESGHLDPQGVDVLAAVADWVRRPAHELAGLSSSRVASGT